MNTTAPPPVSRQDCADAADVDRDSPESDVGYSGAGGDAGGDSVARDGEAAREQSAAEPTALSGRIAEYAKALESLDHAGSDDDGDEDEEESKTDEQLEKDSAAIAKDTHDGGFDGQDDSSDGEGSDKGGDKDSVQASEEASDEGSEEGSDEVSDEGSVWDGQDEDMSTGSSEDDDMIVNDEMESDHQDAAAWNPSSPDMRQRVVRLMREDPCVRKCLEGKAEKLEWFLVSLDAMSKDQRKISLLISLAILQEAESAAPKRKRSTGERHRFVYHVSLVGSVCQGAFIQCYGTSAPSVSRFRKQIDEGNFAAKEHGGIGNRNARRLNMTWVLDWVKEFADTVGEVVPVRVRRYKTVSGKTVRYNSNADTTLIPSSFTWEAIYDEFLAYAKLDHIEEPLPAFATFRAAVAKSCPGLAIRSPRSNVCDICCVHRTELARDPNADIAEKMSEHVEDARLMRLEYKEDRARASDEHYVLTIDYAQNLTVPSVPETPSQWYFLSLFSISVFGVHLAHKDKQWNYVYSELKGGKGSNEVISLICRTLGLPEKRYPDKKLTLYADNCGGQNKNNFVLKFCLLLTDAGLFREVQLKFLIKGHTKNACDGGFGHIKKHVSRHEIWTIPDMVKTIEAASKSTVAIGLDEEPGSVFNNYKSVLTKLYKNLKGIQQYQLFRFRSSRKGIIESRRRPRDVAVEHDLRKKIKGHYVEQDVLEECLSLPLIGRLPPPKAQCREDA